MYDYAPDARSFGEAYTNSHIRKKRNRQAKQGKLLTKQGRKRKNKY